MRLLRATLLVAGCCLFVNGVAAQQSATPDWQAWNFLIGDWVGTGSGQPGQGSGGFTLKPDLQGRVLVRTNYAEYPATKERAAFRHDDLMIIYHETDTGPAEAIYFDSEGHVIRYGVTIDAATKTAVFASPAESAAPRYRLTYSAKPGDVLGIKFEIAPPGKPDEFKTYIEATAKRASK